MVCDRHTSENIDVPHESLNSHQGIWLVRYVRPDTPLVLLPILRNFYRDSAHKRDYFKCFRCYRDIVIFVIERPFSVTNNHRVMWWIFADLSATNIQAVVVSDWSRTG